MSDLEDERPKSEYEEDYTYSGIHSRIPILEWEYYKFLQLQEKRRALEGELLNKKRVQRVIFYSKPGQTEKLKDRIIHNPDYTFLDKCKPAFDWAKAEIGISTYEELWALCYLYSAGPRDKYMLRYTMEFYLKTKKRRTIRKKIQRWKRKGFLTLYKQYADGYKCYFLSPRVRRIIRDLHKMMLGMTDLKEPKRKEGVDVNNQFLVNTIKRMNRSSWEKRKEEKYQE